MYPVLLKKEKLVCAWRVTIVDFKCLLWLTLVPWGQASNDGIDNNGGGLSSDGERAFDCLMNDVSKQRHFFCLTGWSSTFTLQGNIKICNLGVFLVHVFPCTFQTTSIEMPFSARSQAEGFNSDGWIPDTLSQLRLTSLTSLYILISHPHCYFLKTRGNWGICV